MTLTPFEFWALVWIGAWSGWAFLLFGFDKSRSRKRGASRVSEAALCGASALGGWPGGLLGLVVFRHKSAKASFQLKFAVAFFAWAGLVYAVLRFAGRI